MHRVEGQFWRLNSTLNKLKSLKFRFSTRWPKDSKGVGKYFEHLKAFVEKKMHLDKASEHSRRVISSNLKHYYSRSLDDWKDDGNKEIQNARPVRIASTRTRCL
jgi:hypothetical protein